MADWGPLHEPVGDFARSVAFDLPGYGEADKPEGFDYTISGYAAFIDAALNLLGIGKAHLVVHDFGAQVLNAPCSPFTGRRPKAL
jgi:pimeloyl-ACP methyl ester carboxylesterase